MDHGRAIHVRFSRIHAETSPDEELRTIVAESPFVALSAVLRLESFDLSPEQTADTHLSRDKLFGKPSALFLEGNQTTLPSVPETSRELEL